MSESHPAAVIVLAAGEGTRMKSSTPKVLHRLAGRSLLDHVLVAARPLGGERTFVVVGHGRSPVAESLAHTAPEAITVDQVEQHGTGHAVRLVLESSPDLNGTVVVLCGDTPLLTSSTLVSLVAAHEAEAAAVSVLTARVPDPFGYGRIVRDEAGHVRAIVEERDATEDERAIDEINAGIYAFDAAQLRGALTNLTRDNSQAEEYLTDVVAALHAAGGPVLAVRAVDHREILGVNDRVQLAQAGAVLRDRINEAWMRAGVSITDPTTTWIEADVTVEPDVVIHPQTTLLGGTALATGAEVGPGCWLADTVVGEGAVVRQTTADGALIGPAASVGPYTYLRPGTVLGANARAGAFVETKNAQIGAGSKVPHLSYVGDAEIGEGSNIGAATVVVNYDGVAKHQTVIGDHVRIGSDTMLVAPVEIGDGAYTAAGSVITDDVPAGAMGVGRARQRTIRGWVARKRPGTSSADAATRAGRDDSDDAVPDDAVPDDAGPPSSADPEGSS